MNNPSLDRLMMEASAAAYNVSMLNPLDPNSHAATLSGADPNGLIYNVDQNGYVQNTLLGAYGYRVEAGFDDAFAVNPTGFKAVILSRTKADGTKDWIVSFTGTEPTALDLASDLQLGWNQWNSAPPQGGQAVIEFLRTNVQTGSTINFTGHSLGGGLAEYAAYYAKTDQTLSQLNLTLTTFNSMGVRDSLALHEGLDQSAVDTAVAGLTATHYIRKGDIVGLLGGHVGDTVSTADGLVSNVYELGTNTLFLGDAHVLPTLYQDDLYSAHNYNPDYLTIHTTKRLINTIVELDTQGITDPRQMLSTALESLFNSMKNGDPVEVNSFMRWVVDNLKDSSKISAPTHALLIDIDWAGQIKDGVLSSPTVYTALYNGLTAWDKVTDTFTALKDWAGTTASQALDSITSDIERFINSIETYVAPTDRGTPPALELIAWLDSGYSAADVMTAAQGYANQLTTNPDALKTQIDSNPLSFLPPLTAPNAADYSGDAPGQAAYQLALDLYNQKLTERTEVQNLYTQYQAYLQNLPEPTYNGPGHGTDPQPTITGTVDPDANAYYPNSPYLNAAAGFLLPTQESGGSVVSGAGNLFSDAITQVISGDAGADVIEGHAVVG
ncbi:MAG: DUF2974 domain-containing protein, partial [candidate division Zixibacteria bacterium]|nr:DUF2974 domain-containing protein [candidate division Zixibacteria bacterium]